MQNVAKDSLQCLTESKFVNTLSVLFLYIHLSNFVVSDLNFMLGLRIFS